MEVEPDVKWPGNKQQVHSRKYKMSYCFLGLPSIGDNINALFSTRSY